MVRLARTTGKESRGRQSSAGGSHQKGARLVASGVEREEEREGGESRERYERRERKEVVLRHVEKGEKRGGGIGADFLWR